VEPRGIHTRRGHASPRIHFALAGTALLVAVVALLQFDVVKVPPPMLVEELVDAVRSEDAGRIESARRAVLLRFERTSFIADRRLAILIGGLAALAAIHLGIGVLALRR